MTKILILPQSMNIRISRNGQEFGPYTMEELTQYVNEGSILPDDYAYDGMEWITVTQLLNDPQRVFNRVESITNTAKSGSVITPEVWNPEAVGVFSVFLTPFWGSILLAKNWESLNHPEKSAKVRNWGWVWLIVVLANVLLPEFVDNVPIALLTLPLLILWYFIVVKEQVNYLKNTNISYYKKGWLKPQMLGIGGIVIFVFVLTAFMMVVFPDDISEDQIRESTTSLVTKLIQQNTESNIYCARVTIEEKILDNNYIGTAILSDGTQLKINITLNGDELSVVIPEQ